MSRRVLYVAIYISICGNIISQGNMEFWNIINSCNPIRDAKLRPRMQDYTLKRALPVESSWMQIIIYYTRCECKMSSLGVQICTYQPLLKFMPYFWACKISMNQ